MRKKIAYIGIKALPGKQGVDAGVEKIVTRMDHDRFEPVVYVSKKEVPEDTVIPGVKMVRMPALPGKFTYPTSLFLFSALHALFRGDYDVVNVHNVEAAFIFPILRLRYKVVGSARGLLGQEPDELSKWGKSKGFIGRMEWPFMHMSDKRTSVSKPDQIYLEEKFGIPVEYVPNGVDELKPDIAGAQALLESHGLEPGKFMLFTAGRIMPRKGAHFVLEAMSEMDEDMKLLIVGDTSHVPEYEAQLHEMADDRVRFHGFISSKELLYGVTHLAHLFLFPTTYEGMANTLLETAAVRTPMIASDIPENVAVLPDQALYFRNGDSADLRDKMQWALAHPQEMKAMADQAYQQVSEHYRWSTVIEQFEQIYDELTPVGNGKQAAVGRG